MPLLKRLAARLFGQGPDAACTHSMRFSWLHGQADGFRSGHECRRGVRLSRRAMLKGIEEGRQVLLIQRHAPAAMSTAPRAWTTACSTIGACH
jgi:hypothetical protein